MDVWLWTLLVIICGLLYYYLKKPLNYFEELGIPYIPGWPVLGNMSSVIFRRKHINDVVREIYNVHSEAKYVGAFDFTTPVIVLRDPELIKSITIKDFDNFVDHRAFIDDSVDPLFGGNLFNLSGNRWKKNRNVLTPAFTSSKMKGMFQLMVESATNLVNYLAEQKKEDNRMVNTKSLFTMYANDVLANCAFGVSINTLKDPKNDFYVYGKEATTIDTVLTVKFLLARSFPELMKFFQIKFIRAHVSKFFTDIVKMTVTMRDEKSISRPDMLQLMMDTRRADNKHMQMNITEMTSHAFTFFFGGFDSTSTQMCMMAHLLAINPDVQKRLQEEIDDVMKETSGTPTYDAVNNMPYLDAVFNETLRRYTQAGFLDRICTKTFELPPALPGGKPFVARPGMNIWIPASGIHLDPKYYDEPEKFDPDRYYQKKVTINDVNNLGFGIGPRACIGNRFAILETKILFFLLLSKFNLKPNEKTCIPLEYEKGVFAVVAKGGFWLTIESRG